MVLSQPTPTNVVGWGTTLSLAGRQAFALSSNEGYQDKPGFTTMQPTQNTAASVPVLTILPAPAWKEMMNHAVHRGGMTIDIRTKERFHALTWAASRAGVRKGDGSPYFLWKHNMGAALYCLTVVMTTEGVCVFVA